MTAELVTFTVAFLASFSLTPVARRLAFRVGMLDMPGPRKIHMSPTPLLGGLALYAGASLALVLSMGSSARSQIVGILTAATLLVVVGLLDDRGLLHHQIKLMVAMPLAAVILMVAGVRGEFPWPLPQPWHGVLSVLLTFFWVVGVTAAFSILDHMDGLCAGTAAIASAFFLYFAVTNGQVLVSLLAAAVLGVSLGFLPWNFNPARIFMGDSGAMFLGFMVATLGIKLRFQEIPRNVSWMIPVLITGVPIFDTTLVSVSRLRRGLIPFMSPGKDHTAHRLANLGLGHRGAVLALYGLGLLFGATALLIARLEPGQAYRVGAAVLAAVVVAIALLERAPYDRHANEGRGVRGKKGD